MHEGKQTFGGKQIDNIHAEYNILIQQRYIISLHKYSL